MAKFRIVFFQLTLTRNIARNNDLHVHEENTLDDMIVAMSASMHGKIVCMSVSMQINAWEANDMVHKRVLDLIKPGVKCSAICPELN